MGGVLRRPLVCVHTGSQWSGDLPRFRSGHAFESALEFQLPASELDSILSTPLSNTLQEPIDPVTKYPEEDSRYNGGVGPKEMTMLDHMGTRAGSFSCKIL